MRVLHIEDNEADAELVAHTLRATWPECEIDRIQTREGMFEALGRNPDLVLSDFSMPRFDGLEALRLVRAEHVELPFIFFSGTLGEERALAALQAGATDYLSKDRPKWLVTAIQRTLEMVSERRQRRAAEEKLLHLQRLENIGMLTAGIAHDFNNVLAPVLMATPLLRARVNDPTIGRILDAMDKSAQRGAGLIRQLLGFAHQSKGDVQVFQVRSLLREVLTLLHQTLPDRIAMHDDLATSLPMVRGNPTQLHQVVLNLCVNARDAIKGEGSLSLRAYHQRIDTVAGAAIRMQAGDYVVIEVEDSGSGIPPEILDKIWEPFFTTKGSGKGTGLGLATVKTIVEAHEGFVRLDSVVGRGTCFHLYFPAVHAEMDGAPAAPAGPPIRGHGELILLAEDDTAVAEATAEALRGLGYEVLLAADGTQAVAMSAQEISRLRLVIADLSMPGLNGLQASQIIRSLNPRLPILMVSGVVEEERQQLARQWEGPFLRKPFTLDELGAKLGPLLQAAGAK